MSTLRQLRNFWIPWMATMVLVCSSDAVAQVSYKITDLGTNHGNDNFSMAMGLNNHGWAENMDGFVNPPENNLFTTVARGRAVINVDGLNIDLGTLGKPDGNSWINWGGINERGEAVGMSETAVPDPDGEDICGFGVGEEGAKDRKTERAGDVAHEREHCRRFADVLLRDRDGDKIGALRHAKP